MLINWLAKGDSDDVAVSEQLKAGADFSESLLHSGETKDTLDRLAAAGIAYDFSLDMTETNNLDATIDFLDVLRKSMGLIGITGGLDRSRENIESFTLTDTFRGLLEMPTEYARTYCNKYVTSQNMIYPITGAIGIRRILNTFLGMTLFSNLTSKDEKKAPKGPPTYTATLTFTTLLSGTIAPKITFAPFRGAGVADLSANAVNSRRDVHQLVIGLALPDGTANTDAQGGSHVQDTASDTYRPGLVASGSGGPIEQRAVQAIDQAYVRQGLSRAGVIPIPFSR